MLPADRRWCAALSAAALILAGCNDGGSRMETGFTVVDSAGIPIVSSFEPQWSSASAWRVDSVPISVIGVDGSDPMQQFTTITLATRLRNANTAVAASGEIRWFDSAGKYLRSSTRTGDGPREFRSVSRFLRGAGDTLVAVGSSGRAKRVIIAPNGEIAREETFECEKLFARLGLRAACGSEMLADGTLIVVRADSSIPFTTTNRPTQRYADGRTGVGSGHIRDLRRAYIVPPAQDTMYPASIFAGIEYFDIEEKGFTTMIVHPFYSRRTYVAGGGWPPRYAMATNPEYEIHIWSTSGKLERIVRRPRGRRTPTEAEIADLPQVLKRMVDQQETGMSLERVMATVPMPDSIPAVYGMLMSHLGELIVQREGFLPSHREMLYDVFDDAGRWMGELRLPAGSRLLEVGENHLLVVRLDADDVQRLEVLRLRR